MPRVFWIIVCICLVAPITHIPAQAASFVCTGQEQSDLLGLANQPLMTALRERLDRLTRLANDRDVIYSAAPTYMLASEGAAHCSIAIGYLRGGTQDVESNNRCDCYDKRLTYQPAATQQTCSSDLSATVYFDFARSDLNSESRAVLARAVDDANRCGLERTVVAGHTDRAGSDAYNDALSERRTDAVATYLITAGVASDRIERQAFGETRPAQPTNDGTSNPLNRRVELRMMLNSYEAY